MYERYFGITGPPFQLSPDPFFYFDSDQHRAALMMLRQAFARAAPILVLSGEIGAGKTTVLRAWLEEVEAAAVVVGQLTNTQLDAEELMYAAATAFGVAAGAGSDAPWRGFLGALKGRAALLVIDEAQNLDHDGLCRLLDLADVAAEEAALLRICLVGQPELRARLADPMLPKLPSRVQPPCHLDPLQPAQTRLYIEHRLLKVGWAGKPAFDAAAFAEIHRYTGGVPRRINVLGNRLMLSQFMGGGVRIDARAVIETADALYAEIGEEAFGHPRHCVVPDLPPATPIARGALLLVANGRSDHIKAVPLLHAMGRRGDLPPAALVSVSNRGGWSLNHELHAFLGLTQQPIPLVDDTQSMVDAVQARFGRLIEQCRPGAIILVDGDPVLQGCASVAREHQVPLVHVGADAQGSEEFNDPRSARAAIRQVADVQFDCQGTRRQKRRFSGPQMFRSVGSVAFDAVCIALRMAVQRPCDAAQRLVPREYLADAHGYGVVALKQAAGGLSPCRPDVVTVLRNVSRDLPLVWIVPRATMLAMQGRDLGRIIEAERICCIDELGHSAFILLLRDATCVITDGLDVQEEAAALGVPCLSLGAHHACHVDAGGWLPCIDVGCSATRATRAVWQILFNGADQPEPPVLWDGDAAARVAAHLAHWLADSR